jgi:HAMP domain-containing protein
MGHWTFVLGAYVLVFGTLLVYWWRVERGIRALERPAEDHPARSLP